MLMLLLLLRKKLLLLLRRKLLSLSKLKHLLKLRDDTIMHGVIIDLINTGVMDETGEVSNATMADEVGPHIQDLASK